MGRPAAPLPAAGKKACNKIKFQQPNKGTSVQSYTSGGKGAGGLLSISMGCPCDLCQSGGPCDFCQPGGPCKFCQFGGPCDFCQLGGPDMGKAGSLFSYAMAGGFLRPAPGVARGGLVVAVDCGGLFARLFCGEEGNPLLVPGFGCSGGFFAGGCGFGDGGRGAGGFVGVTLPGVAPILRGVLSVPPAGSRDGRGGGCRGGTAGGLSSAVDGVDDVISGSGGEGGGEGKRDFGWVGGGAWELSSLSADDVRWIWGCMEDLSKK